MPTPKADHAPPGLSAVQRIPHCIHLFLAALKGTQSFANYVGTTIVEKWQLMWHLHLLYSDALNLIHEKSMIVGVVVAPSGI